MDTSTGGATRRRLPPALRAPFEARTWREFGHLMLGLPLSSLYFAFALTGLSLGAGLLVTFLGVPVLAAALAMCRGFGAVERGRARMLLGTEVADPEPVRAARGGALGWMVAMLKSGASWRHMLYSLVHFPWAVFTFTVSLVFVVYGWAALLYPLWFWVFPAFTDMPGLQLFQNGDHTFYLDSPLRIALTSVAGLLLVLVTPWLVRGFAAVDRGLIRGLLGPSRMAARVTELESDRGVVVDTAAADLRRIERDLHDGAQARLVALAMDLGLAKEKLAEDPQAAARMVDEAHGEVKIALQELRDLARGIHPAILTDRGLDAALSAIASRCPVPGGVAVSVDLPERPAEAIEGIAYFTVSELLANIGKHARARTAAVDVWRAADRLLIQVVDDGRGGAQAAPGSGLAGLAERIGAVDGVLIVDSPPAGGTRVTAELPWRVRPAGPGGPGGRR
ncbi:sensor domain-containing protein [Streptomyces bambusae]|uniref:sensor histidine kinase n=1 Tax=Streptomyces bambusae TaxID=1550616 RepID=UPI001CFCA99E|nr:sensor histidine kinase [Streptomyces bambusae]MCB5168746.1 sensor domain-containing protein [Streptomyces bambusae]